jgi:putative nucleotidyltransferase with HDIG domain
MRKKPRPVNRYQWVRPAFVGAAFYFVMFVLLVAIITPERYDIKVGAPAPVTIFATKDVEDTVTTQKLRDEAADAVAYSFKSVDVSVVSAVVSNFGSVSLKLTALRDKYTEEDVAALSDTEITALGEDAGVTLTRTDLATIVTIGADELDAALSAARSLLRDALDSTLPEGQESAAILKISRDLTIAGQDASLVSVAMAVVRATIQPNMLIDEETTEQNREKARQTVEAQTVVKGEVVVREGDIVTEAQYQILSSLGLIENSSFDLLLISGIALLIALLMGALGLYIAMYAPELYKNPKKLLLLAIIIVLVMGASAFAQSLNTYLMPVALGVMLLSTLLTPKLALFVNVLLGLVTSLFATATSGFFSMAMFSIMIMAILSGPVVVSISSRHVQRTSMLLAGFVVGITNFVTTLAVGLIISASVATVAINAAWAAGGGLLAAVMCIGLQPLIEWMFNLVTSAKLLELSSPNQPLLHRLLLEAPGSYHHSVIVANLADAAATAIGANALLARVGAYYHDIGKLKRPMYFKENQLGDNPHDRTDPRVSTAILTAHTRDGAQMGQKAHLPEEIIDIILQHHGDSPVLYFYDKAKKLYGDDVDVSSFRYEGPRPSRREAAIVMLADMIEAATRSMPSHEPARIGEFVRRLVRDKMSDGQLDKSQLTFRDLDLICVAFTTVLSGVFHERIEYPDIKLPPRELSARPRTEEEAGAVPAGRNGD